MDNSFITIGPISAPNSNEDISELLRLNLDEIIIRKRKNLILCNVPEIEEEIKKITKRNLIDFKIISIDLILSNDRKDCIEQICEHINLNFPQVRIRKEFEKFFKPNLKSVEKDIIVDSILKKTTNKKHIVLIINNYHFCAHLIKEEDYQHLYILFKRYRGRLSCILESKYEVNILNNSMERFLSVFDCTDTDSFKFWNINKVIYEPVLNIKQKTTIMNNPELYISYAWEDESEEIIKNICIVLKSKNIKYHIDKKDVEYKGNINEFEDCIGKGNYIIPIISDKFLKSKDCMYEIMKIRENGNIYNRIFPIVLSTATIYDPIKKIDYLEYWENKAHDLDVKLKKISSANTFGLRDDIDNYVKYRAIMADFITILNKMNTLSKQAHIDTDFSNVFDSINKQYKIDITTNVQESTIQTESTFQHRIVNQQGEKSIYIEKNEGDVIIN